MLAKKKILIFCVPFSGHLNVLKRLMADCGERFDFRLVITGWTNISAVLTDREADTIVLAKSALKETDPALWTFPRVAELFDDCLAVAKEFKPDLIMYDFFSLEGFFVGKQLGIPVWCSIPAMIGPFTHQKYLAEKLSAPVNRAALARLKVICPDIAITDFEMISDGVHIAGEVNLLWSYRSLTPKNFLENRRAAEYVFVGNPAAGHLSLKKKRQKPLVFFSLGTVVMDNLWNQQPELRQRLSAFIETVAAHLNDESIDVIFVTQGKKVLERYPKNWQVFDQVDQVKLLAETDVFITHGGSNSFHEAALNSVPMVALPFFGDQPLVARQIEDLGIGTTVVKDDDVATHKSKHFLDADLAQRLSAAVFEVLKNKKYADVYRTLPLEMMSVAALLAGEIAFDEGDLLYGTNIARKRYVEETDSQKTFRILEFRPFSELAPYNEAMPRIVDIYHDAIRNDAVCDREAGCSLQPYARTIAEYREHLQGESDIGAMCIKGLDFFTRRFRIHFILEEYDPKVNYITTKEIIYVLEHQDRFLGRVIFYVQRQGTWLPREFSEVATLL